MNENERVYPSIMTQLQEHLTVLTLDVEGKQITLDSVHIGIYE
jgi:hypothetical protein